MLELTTIRPATGPRAEAGPLPYDFAIMVESLHDVARPVEILQRVRESLSDAGVMIVADEKTGHSLDEPGPADAIFYGFSVLCCLPAGTAETPIRTGARARLRVAGHHPAPVATHPAQATPKLVRGGLVGLGANLGLPFDVVPELELRSWRCLANAARLRRGL